MRNTCTVGERLRTFGQSCWRRKKAAIKIFEMLQTTTYSKFDLLGNWSQTTYWKTVIAFVLGNHRIRDKYVPKKYFYTFRINQITFTYGERKEKRPNFYGMFSQNLSISTAFTAILKNEATTMQRNLFKYFTSLICRKSGCYVLYCRL